MTKVKICGITNAEDALAACEAGADAVGFVFAPEAKPRGRYVERDTAREIVEQLPPFVTTVAVCVNEPIERLAQLLSFIDCIQFHGEEDPATVESMAWLAIKAFRVGPDFNVEEMRRYRCRAYLLDAYSAEGRGGTGQKCDWESAKEAVAACKRVILAGGLTPENVADAVRTVRPYAVDVSGGVEAAPGKKDHERIRQFIRNAKTALA